MSVSEEQAARAVGAVTALSTTGLEGVTRVAVSGSSQNAAIPPELRGRWVDLYCTTEVQYGFSTTGTARTLVLNQASALGTGSVAAGKTLPAGIDKPVLVPRTATHISWIGTTGFIEIVCSECP